ncbi:GTPase-associated system all-helical protein GASH [Paraburkholderia sediminicola]|uniref:GTPase-associated system all-helical protein GASH n=1 Tax=Paraburkholderia sediminicola TaxID=458836 RepID=UPI0038BD5B4E
MLDIAKHVRIFDTNPTDDLVNKRKAAIAVLAKKFSAATKLGELFAIGNSIAVGATSPSLPEAFAKEIEAAIKDESSAFVLEGNELEALVCALLAAGQAVDAASVGENWYTSTVVLAVGLWSPLSFLPANNEPKLELLCAEVRDIAMRHVAAVAESARRRSEVPAIAVGWPNPAEAPKIEEAINEGMRGAIDALRKNAILDREELDILWWALGDRSSLLGQSLSTASTVQTAVAAGIEIGRIVRRPPADAHKHLALRHVREDRALSLEELLTEIAPVRSRLSLTGNPLTRAKQNSLVFPLTCAIATGKGNATTGAETTRPLSDWCARALLETAVLELTEDPHPGV